MNKTAKVKSAKTKSSAKSDKRPAKNAVPGLTSSGPSHPPQDPPTAMGKHAAEQQSLAANVPFNPTKVGEYGLRNALSPMQGAVQEMPSKTAGAGTLSEAQQSAKTGAPAVAPTAPDGALTANR